jgi:hypothetical protein
MLRPVFSLEKFVVPICQDAGWIPVTIGNQAPFAYPQLIIVLDLEKAE